MLTRKSNCILIHQYHLFLARLYQMMETIMASSKCQSRSGSSDIFFNHCQFRGCCPFFLRFSFFCFFIVFLLSFYGLKFVFLLKTAGHQYFIILLSFVYLQIVVFRFDSFLFNSQFLCLTFFNVSLLII